MPHVPRRGPDFVRPDLCRRPRAGQQVLLSVEAAGSLGRGRFPLSRRCLKNYIKRLTGLPGETLWINHGALWTRPNGKPGQPYRIARKPPEKLLAMLEPVFDNDYMPAIANAVNHPGPDRWGGDGWRSPDEKQFETDGTKSAEQPLAALRAQGAFVRRA